MSDAAPDAGARRELPWQLALGAACVAVYAAAVARRLWGGTGPGEDFSYFIPRLLDGYWWHLASGPFAVPWFTPSFCGGIPRFADAQDLSYALPQLLTLAVDPLRAAYLTGVIAAAVGGLGFALLLARGFGASRWTALLGGVVVLFNGATLARTVAGHLAYHALALVPWACLGAVAPLPDEPGARREALAAHSLLVGVALAYVAWCGLLNVLPALLLAVAAVALLRGLLRGGYRDAALRLALGGALALALGVAKLSAFTAYFSHFRRDAYPLPGVEGALATLGAAARSVFGWPVLWGGAGLANSAWTLDAHEWSYGVGPLPALGLAVALARVARRRPLPRPSRGDALALAALVALLLVPVAVNVYTPGWNAFLKGLPVLSSSSNLLRWWLAYVVIAPLGVLGFELLPGRHRRAVALAGVAASLAAFLAADLASVGRVPYNPRPALNAWRRSHDAGSAPPVVAVSVTAARSLLRNTVLVRGESQLFCYEPAFGYALERFPRGPLHVGPALDVQNGVLNLKNPACYLWPAENRCRPGDHFRADQREAAVLFASRRPFPFAMPRKQRIANAVSLSALALTAAAAPALALLRLRRRRGGRASA